MQQPAADTLIWHYFDFAKFVALLDTGCLFLAAASSLEDPFEGAGDPEGRDRVMISSWHANADESIAMWKLYARSPESLAIRSTPSRLAGSLERDDRFELRLSQVEYVDRVESRACDPDPLAPYICKVKPYAYESEVRLIADLRGRDDETARQALRDQGVYLRADLSKLIEAVYISPFAGRWFLDLTRGILRKYRVQLQPSASVLAA